MNIKTISLGIPVIYSAVVVLVGLVLTAIYFVRETIIEMALRGKDQSEEKPE